MCLLVLDIRAQGGQFVVKAAKRGSLMSFPIIASNAQDSVAAYRINRLLQLLQLKLLVFDHNTKNIFEAISPVDSSWSQNREMTYKVLNNSDRVLAVGFYESSCGGTCHYWNGYYNFNASNGDLIQIKDLILPIHYQRFRQWLFEKRSTQLKNAFVAFKKNKEDTKYIGEAYMNDIIEAYKTDEMPEFYIKDSTLYVDGYNHLCKECKILGLDALCRTDATILRPYLNAYGRAVLGLKSGSLASYRSSSLPQLFTGFLAGQPIVLALEQQKVQKVTGSYAYLKYGKAISLSGTLKSGVLRLTEWDENEKGVNGYIHAQLRADTIQGNWQNSTRTKTYLVEIHR